MAEMTREQETHTFATRPRSRLFAGMVWVATAVILAAAIGAQTSQSILFRALFGLGCVLFAASGVRFASMRVKVRGGQLIVRNFFRTHTVNAGEVRGTSWDWLRGRVAPRVLLADGGSILLAALWSYGYRQAELAATVEKILSLLGVKLPDQEQSPGWLPDRAQAPESPSGFPDSSRAGLPSEPIGTVEDKTASLARAKSPAGLPDESGGARRPPRQKGWRIALSFLPGVLLGTWIVLAQLNANSAWAMVSLSLFIVSACILYAAGLVRLIVRMWRNSHRYRARPPSGQG